MSVFESNLRELFSSDGIEFQKLEEGQPYYFDHWANDRNGAPCLYYWFSSHDGKKRHAKRVIISEINQALEHLRKVGSFTRSSFRTQCPKSDSSGHCGFTVIGRIMEMLGVARYSGREHGFIAI
jgi:hypothetical protein